MPVFTFITQHKHIPDFLESDFLTGQIHLIGKLRLIEPKSLWESEFCILSIGPLVEELEMTEKADPDS